MKYGAKRQNWKIVWLMTFPIEPNRDNGRWISSDFKAYKTKDLKSFGLRRRMSMYLWFSYLLSQQICRLIKAAQVAENSPENEATVNNHNNYENDIGFWLYSTLNVSNIILQLIFSWNNIKRYETWHGQLFDMTLVVSVLTYLVFLPMSTKMAVWLLTTTRGWENWMNSCCDVDCSMLHSSRTSFFVVSDRRPSPCDAIAKGYFRSCLHLFCHILPNVGFFYQQVH